MPQQVALDDGEHRMTYRELDERANQLAHVLQGRGIGGRSRVGILLHRSAQTYISLLAILKAGAAFVPIDPGSPRERVGLIADDAALDLLITSTDLAADLAQLSCRTLTVDTLADTLAMCPTSRPTIDRDSDATCYVIYTSGSSGRPKGVAVTQSSICNFIDIVPRIYGVRSTDRVYQGMTIAFDFSIEEIWPTFAVGATLVVGPNDARRLGSELAEYLHDTGVTVFYCVPTLLGTIGRDLPAIRTLIVGGEACPGELVERWSRPGRRILNTYGPTEATVTATCGELVPDRPVTIGRPLPTYEIVLLDEDLRPVPRGEVGEICIGGPGVARGYVGRPELTADRFITHPLAADRGRLYRTGDLGRLDDSDEIEYHGRADTQVKIRGYRVELAEIESVLAQVPGIAQAVVDTYEPEPGLTELVGYYRLRDDTDAVDQGRIVAHLRGHLPAYMVPAYLEQLDVIPRLPSDKVDRKSLPPPRGPRSVATQRAYLAPTSDTERILAEVLAKVVRVDQLSVDSHFFDDLGANSLLLATFCARVRERADLPPVSMKDVYLHPTIRALAAALPAATNTCAASPEPPQEPATRASMAQYVMCGALQVLLFLTYTYAISLVLVRCLVWVLASDRLLELYLRSVAASGALLVASVGGPILTKWLLIGRWKSESIRIWSLAYVRFWFVKTLVRSNPMVLFAGSPLYGFYLRALGARIGRGTVIFSRHVPLCTDLLSIGAGTVVRRDVSFNCYRARAGVIQTGAVTIGANAVVGAGAVLDIDTSLGDGAQLGHTSSLHAGQTVPAGESWHGSPAQRTTVDYRAVDPRRCGLLRRFVFGMLQLFNLLLVALPLVAGVAVLALRKIPILRDLWGPGITEVTTWAFYRNALVLSSALFFGSMIVGLAFVLTVPRALHRLTRPGRTYPLYGVFYWIHRFVRRTTNVPFFLQFTGDSSYIVHYLRALGYRFPQLLQTGSNIGAAVQHETPYQVTIGRGTMISDGLSMINAEFSNTSFRIAPVSIPPRNFLGNNILYPADARTGEDCLLATKVMVPVDGPVREGVGLLGSPCFEIPRTVQRDTEFGHPRTGDEFRRRLAAKNRYNLATMGLFLLVHWIQFLIGTLLALAMIDAYAVLGAAALAGSVLVSLLIGTGYLVLVERAIAGFRALSPKFCSIYEPYFWWHERYWKFLTALNLLNGTPFKSFFWRLTGVRVGRRLFDDGCAISERTLVEIGDDCTLNAGSMIQCHSMEEGIFKSDRTVLGVGCTLGTGAFIHYGVTIRDGALLSADSFLMKGEDVPAHAQWGGNPARAVPVTSEPRPAARRTLERRSPVR